MCGTCGCGDGETRIEGDELHEHGHTHADGTTHHHPHDHAHDRGQAHDHGHAYMPAHSHAPGVPKRRMVQIEQDILAKNNAYAEENRKLFAERGIFALNLVSSPGSGKTSLLVKTIEALHGTARVAVIEGDQQTSQDAERIRATGAPAVQINTGKGCHLDAHMVGHALEKLELADDGLLMIENVGNLVCPAAFDLGEAHKVVILSVTEGEDKPIKYPDMFRAARLMLLNKCDLLPYLSFSVPRAIEYARRVNPGIEVIQMSSTTGEGMDAWLAWIARGAAEAKGQRIETVASLKRRIAELEQRLAQAAG
ncbi:MAG: hydrogenase nickel incorporation protein HypB [Rhodocyclaceae bacterium]|nr:hydrogenase nickel incorporation protein HypB [Rhodocyclaceae bacterium]